MLASLGCTPGQESEFGASVATVASELADVLGVTSLRLLEVTHWVPTLIEALDHALQAAGADLLLVDLRQPGTVQVSLLTLSCWHCPPSWLLGLATMYMSALHP